MEDSSLVLLANVALNNRPKSNLQKKECPKSRKLRTKTLKITNFNGDDHAEITDLKCIPISTLFKIFIEKFEDKKLHCLVYVCKYGQKQSCNTRFFDVKENRINRLEHLVQCHLLEHLTKTKTGSMIKLPKLFSTFKKTIPFINRPKPFTNLKPNYEEVEWKSEEKKTDPITIEVKKELPKPVAKLKSEVIKNGDILESVRNADTKQLKSSLNTTENSVESNIRRIKFDHPYSNMSEISPNIIPVSSIREAVIPVEYQTVDVDKLYYLNGESSSELNSFMIHETLNEPVPIMVTDDKQVIIEQLPLVGCEAEVTTEIENITETVTDDCSSESDELYFPCTKCDIVLSSKYVFYLHMKNRHSDSTIFKQIKGSRKSRVCSTEPTIKRKFEIVTEYRNTDLFEVVKENKGNSGNKLVKEVGANISKTALLKESNGKKPVINISNVWNSINVQYV